MTINTMNTMSDDINLSWDITQNLKSMSGDIKIKWNFAGNSATTMSGDIKIKWNNIWNIQSMSGDVKLKNNWGTINTTSWDIELEKNSWNVSSTSWDIEAELNEGHMKTTSWNINTVVNNWSLETVVWQVNIWDIKIMIEKFWITMANAWDFYWWQIKNIVHGNNNTVISYWSSNVVMNNWKVLINWREVSNNSNNWEDIYKVNIDNLTIDFINKKFYINNKEIDIDKINSTWSWQVHIINNDIVVNYKWQDIQISKECIKIQW